MVAVPLGVWGGVNDPHDVLGVQLQVTPLLAASFETVAEIVAVALVCMDVGGAVVRATEIGWLLLPFVVPHPATTSPSNRAARNSTFGRAVPLIPSAWTCPLDLRFRQKRVDRTPLPNSSNFPISRLPSLAFV